MSILQINQGLSHTSMVHKRKVKIKCKKTLQDLHISHERNESENIPILVEERGDAFRGIPKLRCLSLLEYLLWVPLGIPKLDLLPLFLFLISRPPRSNTSSTQNFNRKLGKISQYNNANHYSKYCCKPIHILFLHCVYCIIKIMCQGLPLGCLQCLSVCAVQDRNFGCSARFYIFYWNVKRF